MTDQQQPNANIQSLLWVRFPSMMRRISPSLGTMAQDGIYLGGFPVVGSIVPLIGLLAGLAVGLMDRDGLPYTADLAIPATLLVLGMLSGQAGLFAFLGFVASDIFVGFDSGGREIGFGFVAAKLISWFFLFQLVVALPTSARALTRLPGRWSALNGLFASLTAAGFVELWTRLSMVALRPLYIWRGEEPPVELSDFVDLNNALSVGPLTLHLLAWLALGVGLARWAVESFAPAHALHFPHGSGVSPKAPESKLAWWVSAVGRASAATAIISGVFASIAGAITFWAAIFVAIALRIFASGNGIVAKWDGWMLRIPMAIRLVATFALSYYFSQVLVDPMRNAFEWRTMTTAAVASAITFAAALLFWPQVVRVDLGPSSQSGSGLSMQGLAKVAPLGVALILTFTATAAHAHHCSFQPGCECLTDNRALAALVAAWATLASLLGIREKPLTGEERGNEPDGSGPDAATAIPTANSPMVAPAEPAATATSGTEAQATLSSGVDIETAVAALIANAIPPWTDATGTTHYGDAKCAAYVRQAINAGGGRVIGVESAKDFGPQLVEAGFSHVIHADKGQLNSYADDPSQWKKGDVVVIQAFPGVEDGHMAMYDGNSWISDFKQRDMWGGPSARTDRPAFDVYRP